MRANKMETSKIKIAVVLGLLCSMVMGMSAMAFDLYYPYNIPAGQTKTIGQFVPNASTIYINIHPSAGDVTIYLSGAANGSATFSHDTSRPDWVVTLNNPSATLTIRMKAGPNGSSGTLRIRS